jgi:hypothetical protein
LPSFFFPFQWFLWENEALSFILKGKINHAQLREIQAFIFRLVMKDLSKYGKEERKKERGEGEGKIREKQT